MNPSEPEVKVNNPLSSMQAGERNIFEVKRHPFGMLVTYISAGVLVVVAAVVVFAVAPMIFADSSSSQVESLGAVAFVIFSLLVLGFVFIANKVYWGNRWILTSDSLTQVTQRSLFDKQSSQLSLGNLEDVTASQDGILPHMFNFGVLRVETAGERSKFVFVYCPNPSFYAQQILHAREAFEQGRRPAAYGNQGLNHGAVPAASPPENSQVPASGYNVPLGPEDDKGVNTNTEQ